MRDETWIDSNSPSEVSIHKRIALLSESQHGPVERSQIVRLGMAEWRIDYRVNTEQWFVLFPGVYALGSKALSDLGKLSAAVLACGEGAVASHRSGGKLRGVVERYDGLPEVLVPRHNPPELDGIITRTSTLYRYESGSRLGIPVTSLARTFLDLANVLPERDLIRAFQRARRQGLTFKQMDRLLLLHRGERGTRVLRKIVELYRGSKGDGKGGFEDAFYAWLLDVLPLGFPRPLRNHKMTLSDGTPIEADLYWPHLRLIIELDFWDHHGGDRLQTTLDHQRDRDVRNDGWGLERFTSDEFALNRARVDRDVRRLLKIG